MRLAWRCPRPLRRDRRLTGGGSPPTTLNRGLGARGERHCQIRARNPRPCCRRVGRNAPAQFSHRQCRYYEPRAVVVKTPRELTGRLYAARGQRGMDAAATAPPGRLCAPQLRPEGPTGQSPERSPGLARSSSRPEPCRGDRATFFPHRACGRTMGAETTPIRLPRGVVAAYGEVPPTTASSHDSVIAPAQQADR